MPTDIMARQPSQSSKVLKPFHTLPAAKSDRFRTNVFSVALAAGLGCIAALAFAPYFILPFTFVGFMGFLILLRRTSSWRSGLLLGWAFGLGQFLFGLNWIAESFKVEAETLGALAWPAVVGLCALLAVFPAAAAAATRAFGVVGPASIVAFAPLWTAAEMARGAILSGFPWNLVGYVWGISDETLQIASLLGIYGVSLITLSISSLSLLFATRNYGGVHSIFFTLFAVVLGSLSLWGFGVLRLAGAESGTVPGVQLRLVQANIYQEAKWDPGKASEILARYIRMSNTPRLTVPTHVFWPESALPYLFDGNRNMVDKLTGAIPPSGALAFGAVRQTRRRPDQDPALLNSMLVLDAEGRLAGAYDKIRLVPFGEFMPMKALLPIKKLTSGSIDFIPGEGPQQLDIPGLPAAMPLICYEAIFPGSNGEGRAHWILNATNDAWFGTSSGPYQHFLAARVRSIELGLPMVRVANTGISAVVDAYGRIVDSLALGTAGVIDAPLPLAVDHPTAYDRFGDVPVLALIAAMLFTAGVIAASSSRRSSGAVSI
jgi:apolipoprotein N-acyltransferase